MGRVDARLAAARRVVRPGHEPGLVAADGHAEGADTACRGDRRRARRAVPGPVLRPPAPRAAGAAPREVGAGARGRERARGALAPRPRWRPDLARAVSAHPVAN